jgi:hypothetical protein
MRVRSVHLAVPLMLVGGVLVASEPPVLVRLAPVRVPVTGSLANPCTGEELVFGGEAEVEARSAPGGYGAFQVHLHADLADGVATSPAGTQYDVDGYVDGAAVALAPLPATIDVDGNGILASPGSEGYLVAGVRFQLSVEEDGSVVPTGSAEVRTLECAERPGS